MIVDDAVRLMKDARKSLKELLGSTIVSRVGFRDNYVIIGKQGLPSGGAIEDVRSSASFTFQCFIAQVERSALAQLVD